LEAAVEFFPKVIGQAGDFAVAGHKSNGEMRKQKAEIKKAKQSIYNREIRRIRERGNK
jgi:hypothetical protein